MPILSHRTLYNSPSILSAKKKQKRDHCLHSFNADEVNGLTSTEPTFLLLESLILTVSQEILNTSQHLFTLFLLALRKTFVYEAWDPEFVKIFSLSIQDLGGWLGRGRKRRSTSATTDWKDSFCKTFEYCLLSCSPQYGWMDG